MSIANIVLTGPECSGKTTLARELSYRYRTVWIPEYARFYLKGLVDPAKYTLWDLEEIAAGTAQWFAQAIPQARKLVFQDTGRFVLSVWGDERFGRRPKNLEQLPQAHLYILCKPDLPFEKDPLRENEHDRDRLYLKYESLLQEESVNYVVVSGELEERMIVAQKAIDKMRSQLRS